MGPSARKVTGGRGASGFDLEATVRDLIAAYGEHMVTTATVSATQTARRVSRARTRSFVSRARPDRETRARTPTGRGLWVLGYRARKGRKRAAHQLAAGRNIDAEHLHLTPHSGDKQLRAW